MHVLQLHARGMSSKAEIGAKVRLSRNTIIQIIDEAAAQFYERCLKLNPLDELADPH